jgi:hypothetical protein
LKRNPQIPHMRDLKGSYEWISEFYFENLAKLQNKGWSKSLRHSAWLDHSAFQLLKTQVKVTSPMAEGNMGKLEVEMVYSNSEKNFCLNICVLLRCESIVETLDPSY